MSGALTGPDQPVIDNNFKYPYGTTEQFPHVLTEPVDFVSRVEKVISART